MAFTPVSAVATESPSTRRLPFRSYVSYRYYVGLWRAARRIFTWKRAWQGGFTYFSYHLARRGLLWKVPPYPLYLGIEPTTACQLRCPHCISGLKAFTRPTGRLDPDLLEKILQELHAYLWGVLFYFQGEPLLHPRIGQLIQLASRYRLFTSLSTNGLLLSEEKVYELIMAGLMHIRISIDGMSQESYAYYRRGGELSVVLEGIERLLHMRKAMRSPYPVVELQMIVFRHNLSEVPAFLRWARQVGVEAARLKTAQVLTPDAETIAEWIPSEASRYQQPPTALPNSCWRLWRSAEITWDGQLLPCCFDKQAEYTFGKLGEETPFRQLWHSQQAQTFRQKVFTHRQSIDICKNCTEGVRVWL